MFSSLQGTKKESSKESHNKRKITRLSPLCEQKASFRPQGTKKTTTKPKTSKHPASCYRKNAIINFVEYIEQLQLNVSAGCLVITFDHAIVKHP